MSLTPQQSGAVRAAGSVAVTAGAGTGKTHMLTERYLHHLRVDGLRPLEIVAATFTERAAAELRGRIRSRLRSSAELRHLTSELEAAQIGTLHSLAGRICREHPDAAGVPFDFRVLDELEQRLWLYRQLPDLIARLPVHLAENIPFATLSGTLQALLADPLTAQRALQQDPARWQELIHQEKVAAYEQIAGEPDWQEAIGVLSSAQGAPGDKMEQQRRHALAAIDSFELGDFSPSACASLDTLNAGRGSARLWGADALAKLKAAVVTLRGLYRQFKDVLELEQGPADETLAALLPHLREAFEFAGDHLARIKRNERVLDFNDLEVHALRALKTPAVREFYRLRWRAFLVDEFQDTNPVQAELLDLLCTFGEEVAERERTVGVESGEAASVRLTVVGDEKQSIYGFRRADMTVFRQVRKQIHGQGGDVVELSTSFRTHDALMATLNQLVGPALADLHQPLEGFRQEAPGEGPFVDLKLVVDGPRLKQFRQQAEAHLLGETVERLLEAGTAVHDPETGEARPVRPGDIALLARTWDTLGPYGEELAARGIPIIHAGGGSLLEQREAKDGSSLLRFLSDSSDDLSLAEVLRSPFFAVSDPELLELAQVARSAKRSWWNLLRRPAEGRSERLDRAARVLSRLLRMKEEELPSKVLRRADELSGYAAVLANLPGGPRRLADWRGFVDFIAVLERGHGGLFAVIRELRLLSRLKTAKVPRPGMEAGDAVTLMSVHNAKGLEWPIVIIPDVTGRPPDSGAAVVFEADTGVAFKLSDEEGEDAVPALYTLLNGRRKRREASEEFRVMYVALTRARDRVILTGSSETGGRLDSLAPGLQEAGVEAQQVPFEPWMAVPKTPLAPASAGGRATLLANAGPGLTEVPVSGLSSYRVCPRRFHFQHVLQHPGAGEGARLAARTGTLTHLALERDLTSTAELQPFDPGLDREQVELALQLAETFRTEEVFAAVREKILRREMAIRLEFHGLVLAGVADAAGTDFVLDYKTGGTGEGDEHLLQVAVYALALGVDRAHIAYLKGGELRSFGADELAAAREVASGVAAGIRTGDFTATPSLSRCSSCAFERICDDSALRNARHRERQH